MFAQSRCCSPNPALVPLYLLFLKIEVTKIDSYFLYLYTYDWFYNFDPQS